MALASQPLSSLHAVVLPPHDVLKAGTRLGRFRIEGIRFRDWFAVTYRARDLQSGSEIALKEYLPIHFAARQTDGTVLPLSTQHAADFIWGRERFVAEAAAMSLVGRTPGLVSVLGTFELNGTAYMAMTARPGSTLAEHLAREGALSPVVVDRMLPSLLKGLERLHAGGLLHLDIRPANIVLDARGQATLLECGGTRAAMAMRVQATPASRTPGYSALELFAAEQTAPPTDIYSLAATLYHCVTGTAPMAAVNRLMDNMVPASLAAAGSYPPGLLAGIDAGLALKVTDRPLTIAAWRKRFEAAGQAKGPVTRHRPASRPLPEVRPATVIPGDAAGIPLPPLATDKLRHLGRTAVLMVSLLVLATAAAAVGGYALRQPTIERAAEERAQAEALQRKAAEAAAREQAAAEERRQAAEAARRQAQARAEAEAEALRRYMSRQTQATAEALRRMEEEAARLEREEKVGAEATARREAEEDWRFDSEAEKARKRAEEQARVEAEALRKAGDDRPRAGQRPRAGTK